MSAAPPEAATSPAAKLDPHACRRLRHRLPARWFPLSVGHTCPRGKPAKQSELISRGANARIDLWVGTTCQVDCRASAPWSTAGQESSGILSFCGPCILLKTIGTPRDADFRERTCRNRHA